MARAIAHIGLLFATLFQASCGETNDLGPAIEAYVADVESVTKELSTIRNLMDDLPLPTNFAALKAHAKATAPARFAPFGCVTLADAQAGREDTTLSGLGIVLSQCEDALGPGGSLTDDAFTLGEAPAGEGALAFAISGLALSGNRADPGGGGLGSGDAVLLANEQGRILRVDFGRVDGKGTRVSTPGLSAAWTPGDSCLVINGEYHYPNGTVLRFSGVRACRQGCFTEGRVAFEFLYWRGSGTQAGGAGEITFIPNAASWKLDEWAGTEAVTCD